MPSGVYRESWAVQPFSAHVRVSPKRALSVRRRRPASAIASQHHHAWIVPAPKQGNSLGLPYPAGRARCGRVGLVTPAESSSRVVLVDTVRLGWLAWPKGSAPLGLGVVGGRAGLAPRPASPRSAGGRGCRGPASRRVARPSIRAPRSLAVTECLLGVGGSSVSLSCPAPTRRPPCRMVVGADHLGRGWCWCLA